MSTPPPTFIRPRSGTELIDAAFVLLRGHYVRLVTLAALLFLPYVVLSLYQTIRWGIDIGGALLLEQVLVYFACAGLAHAAIAIAVADIYHGRQANPGEALRRSVRRGWVVISTTVVATALIFFGFGLLVVPGVLLFTQYFAIPTVAVLEDAGFMASFRRSGELARGHRRTILASIGLTWLVVTMVVAVIELVIGGGLTMMERPVLVDLIGNLLTVLTYPVIATVATLAYYDTRIRGEAYDLEVLSGGMSGGERSDALPNSAAP